MVVLPVWLAVGLAVVVIVLFGGEGLRAPHGWSWRHADWQAESPLHCVTH